MDKSEGYRLQAEAQLEQWQAKIKALRGKAAVAGAELKEKLNKQAEGMEKETQSLRIALQKADNKGDEAWEQLQAKVRDGMARMEAAWAAIADKLDS